MMRKRHLQRSEVVWCGIWFHILLGIHWAFYIPIHLFMESEMLFPGICYQKAVPHFGFWKWLQYLRCWRRSIRLYSKIKKSVSSFWSSSAYGRLLYSRTSVFSLFWVMKRPAISIVAGRMSMHMRWELFWLCIFAILCCKKYMEKGRMCSAGLWAYTFYLRHITRYIGF